MRYHWDRDSLQLFNSFLKYAERIAAADEQGGIFMDGLQAEFNPDRFARILPVQPVKQREYVFSETVLSGGDRNSNNRWFVKCLTVECFKPCDGCIGVCVRLKVSNKITTDIFVVKVLLSAFKLSGNGCFFGRLFGGKIAASSCTAEDTAPDTSGSVAIRTGHAGIKGNLIYFFSISFFEFIVK